MYSPFIIGVIRLAMHLQLQKTSLFAGIAGSHSMDLQLATFSILDNASIFGDRRACVAFETTCTHAQAGSLP